MSKVVEIGTADNDDVGLYDIYDAEIHLYLQLLSPYNSLTAQACAVEYFRRLLVRDHVPPPSIADVLIKSLIRCLSVEYGNIQRDAAWALTNCACSPHEICYKIIQHGGLEALIQCATVTNGETRDQVFWTIGNIALDCSMCHEKVKNSAALPLMIAVLIAPMFCYSRWKRNLVWAMSQIFRGGVQTLHIMFVQAALTGLTSILDLEDPRLKVDAVWTIAYIADDNAGGRQINAVLRTPNLLQRLLELLDDKEAMRAALRALGNLVAGGDDETQVVLDAGLLPRMMELFRTNIPIQQKREIAWILSNVAAGSHRQVDLLFETNDIVETLVNAFNCDDHRVRKEIGWIITNALTGASLNRSRWLCGTSLLSLIPDLLNLRSENDLIERTLYAIELLITKRISYISIFEKYQIIKTIRYINHSESNQSNMLIKGRARRILNEVSRYSAHQIPASTYILIR
uniref:Importin subunit alpha n=1 Tax=Setaria digitata TaxID=48799 RepID=A0A915Q1N5_9BILA